ncbi:uncharacterized protein RB166_015404 [Leptodactylus fuscus]
MAGKIVPKNKTKGVDFCGDDKYYYIVRPDLCYYMRSTNFNKGEDLEIFSLHPACRDGDHYLADKHGYFYIIMGNYYRRVKNMHTDEDATLYMFHRNCQDGDHYLSAGDYFCIIYQDRGVYRRTKDMFRDEDGEEFPLHPNWKNALYYFGAADCSYFVKPHDEWGVQYVRSTNFNEDTDSQTFSFHPSVINFLPGGVGVTMGPSYGAWICIKTISNDSETPVNKQKKITRKFGFDKEKMSSVERNWKITPAVSRETCGLSALIAKSQFSLTADYGGSSLNTHGEFWVPSPPANQ